MQCIENRGRAGLHRHSASIQSNCIRRTHVCMHAPHCSLLQQRSRSLVVVGSVQPDTEEARSPLDAPQEWEAPQPSKRPDIFPEFEKPERVFLPKPLPGDPEMPDEEEEESKKRTEPGDPDPEAPPGEPSEPEPGEPGMEPEKQPDIPTIPE
eukprot:GHUV01002779.1.p3 GENE.GHUV01002779.1~~GHUV01002779.1.p3  ORF type:complete len:152 (+),score=30.41 GHUV01002779.1:270-725(+)